MRPERESLAIGRPPSRTSNGKGRRQGRRCCSGTDINLIGVERRSFRSMYTITTVVPCGMALFLRRRRLHPSQDTSAGPAINKKSMNHLDYHSSEPGGSSSSACMPL